MTHDRTHGSCRRRRCVVPDGHLAAASRQRILGRDLSIGDRLSRPTRRRRAGLRHRRPAHARGRRARSAVRACADPKSAAASVPDRPGRHRLHRPRDARRRRRLPREERAEEHLLDAVRRALARDPQGARRLHGGPAPALRRDQPARARGSRARPARPAEQTDRRRSRHPRADRQGSPHGHHDQAERALGRGPGAAEPGGGRVVARSRPSPRGNGLGGPAAATVPPVPR